jgi:hypothetical protein
MSGPNVIGARRHHSKSIRRSCRNLTAKSTAEDAKLGAPLASVGRQASSQLRGDRLREQGRTEQQGDADGRHFQHRKGEKVKVLGVEVEDNEFEAAMANVLRLVMVLMMVDVELRGAGAPYQPRAGRTPCGLGAGTGDLLLALTFGLGWRLGLGDRDSFD